LAVSAFGEALLVVPKTLVVNGGNDAMDAIIAVRNEQVDCCVAVRLVRDDVCAHTACWQCEHRRELRDWRSNGCSE
jgi:chaperonin GroEL (HSP60 family)